MSTPPPEQPSLHAPAPQDDFVLPHGRRLRILHVEDNPADAFLIRTLIESSEDPLPVSIHAVDTKAAYVAALETGGFDVILSDYRMTDLDGDAALKEAKRIAPDVPVIMVTGELGEERAIEMLKAGAADYVLKDRLQRLVPAIRRALKDAILDQQRRENQRLLRSQKDALETAHRQLDAMVNGMSEGLTMADVQGNIIRMNPAGAALLGFSAETDLHRSIPDLTELFELSDRDGKPMSVEEWPFSKVVRGETIKDYIVRVRRRDGSSQVVLNFNGSLIRDGAGRPMIAVITYRDITGFVRSRDALQQAHDSLDVQVRERTAELNRATEALRAERQRFIDVLDMLPAYVVLLSPDYHVPFANRFFRERFGEAHGRRCYEYLFGRDKPCEVCDTYKVLKTGNRQHWEWQGPDNRIYDITDLPFAGTDGSTMILEMGIDVTERKLAEQELERHRHHLEELVRERTRLLEEANAQLQKEIAERREVAQSLKESEEHFRLAISHTDLIAWQCDRELRLTWVFNPHRNFSSTGLLGKTAAEISGEEVAREVTALRREVLASGVPSRRVIKFMPADGPVQYYDMMVNPRRNARGEINGLMGISLDVTEQVLNEQRLRQNEENLRMLVEHAEEPMMVVDGQGLVECVSGAGARLLGYEGPDLTGMSVESLINFPSRLELRLRFEDFYRHLPLPARATIRVALKGGKKQWLNIEASLANLGKHPEKYVIKFQKL